MLTSILKPQTFTRVISRYYNLHEYQSLDHLKSFDLPTPNGSVAESGASAQQITKDMGLDEVVIKAQVLAGGRGRGHFSPNGFQGGVHIAKADEVQGIVDQMIGQNLITIQSGADGKPCDKVFLCEKFSLARELYFAILLDRSTNGPAVIASPIGGMSIEDLARDQPDMVRTFPIPVDVGMNDEHANTIADFLEVGDLAGSADVIKNMYRCFMESDLTMLEINPLGITDSDQLMLCDAKLNFDDNAAGRQKDTHSQVDLRQENPDEVQAGKFDLNYIGLDGSIGCLVNGAGLAMATMDVINLFGGSPANFLDVGGSADVDQIVEAFRILQNNDDVKAVFVNIFGGIMKCDAIAHGIIEAAERVGITKPIVARLKGTNQDIAMDLLKNSNVKVEYDGDMESAAKKVVALA